jgi:hypothetical protein
VSDIEKTRIYLVFARVDEAFETELCEKHLISGRSRSLTEAVRQSEGFAANAPDAIDGNVDGTAGPDVFLINGLDHYRQEWKRRQNPDRLLIDSLQQLQSQWPRSRIKLLLPERKHQDQELLTDLMQNNIYDFWFTERLQQGEVSQIIDANRDFAALEQYLGTFPAPPADIRPSGMTRETVQLETIKGVAQSIKEVIANITRCGGENRPIAGHDRMAGGMRSTVKPGGSAMIWSEDDGLSAYAAGILLACKLAEHGYKTLLAEIPGQSPRLGTALGIRHPVWNIRNALSRFTAGQENFYQQCIFNNEKYLKDNRAYDRHEFLRCLPELLFFCPDADEPAWKNQSEAQKDWERFLVAWMQWAMFHERFQVILFIGFGHSGFHECVLKRISYWKIMVLSPWAQGFNKAREGSACWPEQSLFLWNHETPALKNELSRPGGAVNLLIPSELLQDFLEIASFGRKPEKLHEKTSRFLEALMLSMSDEPAGPSIFRRREPWFSWNRNQRKGVESWH